MKRLGDEKKVLAHLRRRLRVKPRRKSRVLDRPRSLWHWMPLLLLVIGGLTIVQLGSAALSRWSSPRVNEACVDHRDCGPGEHCLKHLPVELRYCTHACNDDRACPQGMSCGDIASIAEADRGMGAAGAAAASSACIR